MGAEVIKIESRKGLDLLRAEPSSFGSARGTYGILNGLNLNKRGITLDLSQPKAVKIAKKLAKISDIVVENFRPGVMDRLGLGYSALKEIKPDIIMLSASSHGASGPEKYYSGWAATLAPLSGMAEVTGYPDSRPAELRSGADLRGSNAVAFALLAALIYRQRTGEGQYIDLSARESLSCLIGDIFMDYTMNQRIRSRQANRDEIMAPHNCYRCNGEDKWVSIAVATDEEWQALCQAMGHPEWINDERFSDALSRWQNQEEIDSMIEQWTSRHSHYEVMEILQKAGVAAIASFSNKELCQDPHSQQRELFTEVEHPELGKQAVLNPPWKLSATPAQVIAPAPTLGQDNRYVFGELLGMSDEEISSLEDEKVIY
jgi:benzylsuccinate CoA-transferase BbsF subunit